MSEYLSERIKRLRGDGRRYGDRTFYAPVNKLECADGLTLSIQASSTHYCTPRDDDGPWWEFEIGYPSQRVEAIMEYAEDATSPTKTVYSRVPGHIIEKVIAEHGGER